MTRLFKIAIVLALLSCGGRAEDGSPADSEACDPTAADRAGHLPACAAGTSTAAGPGVPRDFAGHVQASMRLSADERAAITRANALAAARNPAGASSLDRGFAAAPVARTAP